MSMLQERRGQPLNNEHGLEIMEAGIYAALVIVASILLLGPLGNAIRDAWQSISDQIN